MWYFLVAALFLLLCYKVLRVSLFWRNKGIPYEPYYCYLYRILWILNTRSFADFQHYAAKRYGRFFGTYKGLTPCIATQELDIAREVLIKQFDKFFKRGSDFKSGDPIWDNSLLNLSHDEWKLMRSAMGYAFTTAKMKPMITKFTLTAQRLIGKLNRLAEANGGKLEREFGEFAKLYAVDTTMAIAYGKDTNCVEHPDAKLIRHTRIALSPGLATLLFFVAPNFFRYVPGVTFPPKPTMDYFRGLAKHMFKEKRAGLDKAIADETADIIDRQLLLQREDPRITDDLMTSQAFFLMIGGLDAVGFAFNISVYYLALFPEAQRRAYEEIRSLLGDRREVEYRDLQQLKYVEALILESFRFFPFAFQLDRLCTIETEVCGIRFEKGMAIDIFGKEMMRDPRYFSKPAEFRPERFLKEEPELTAEMGAFLLFGDGPKHCPGKRLALMNSQTALANVILAFKFEKCPATPAHPPELRSGFDFEKMMRKPLVIRIIPRSDIRLLE
ncbi:cytochrome P450 3A9 [Galendromus occidentalis]|uniref:Cytochrome P450 3A9 n=1 Tax=Galendromus occidentalis TaxID=34638 RepID=A0AAJ6QNA3_9ACAR|nr:cytochrome P450 3A9 [Galendromus occidentalis]